MKRSNVNHPFFLFSRGKKTKKTKEKEDPEFHTFVVIDELPHLEVAESHMFSSAIGILEGEKFTALLEIENVGTKPVNYMQISFDEKFPDGLSYEEDFYFCKLPPEFSFFFSYEEPPKFTICP